MFMGMYEHTLDVKGRTIVPAKMRELLGDKAIVTLGMDECLYVYPEDEWEKVVDKLRTLPGTKEARILLRRFMSCASECDISNQGRILIPENLRDMAGLTKDVVFSGALNKIELFSKERWDKMQFEDMDEIAEHMAQFGISF